MVKIIGVIAHDMKYGIGYNNELPWPRIKEDMQHFKETTNYGTIVMGRNTWDSLGNKKLPNRKNVVISNFQSKEEFIDKKLDGADLVLSGNIEDIVETLKTTSETDIFVIGGVNIINQFESHMDELIISSISGIYKSDVYLDLNIFKNYYQESMHMIRYESPAVAVFRYKRNT